MLNEAEARKTKKNCTKGNPFHDKNGRLSSKADAKSWSLQFGPDGPDCKSGAVRMPGHRATQKDCGRACKHCGNKADYKCKNGEKVDEGAGLVEETDRQVQDLKDRLNVAIARIQKLEDALQQSRSTEMARCLKKVDLTQRAASGDLFKAKSKN